MAEKTSSWKIEDEKNYPKLQGKLEADVVIIGAGLVGVLNAYFLSKAGLKVIVLEKDKAILRHKTLFTTAFITKEIDTDFSRLESFLGRKKAKLVWQSGEDAIGIFASLAAEENIDCEFTPVSSYTYAKDKKEFEDLKKEYQIIKDAEMDISLKELNFPNAGFWELPHQAKFHPIKFAARVAELAEKSGVKFYTNSEVLEVKDGIAKTKDAQVKAKDILIATYRPLIHKGTHFKKGMYVTYMYELQIPRGLIPEAIYQDMHEPYHYFRIDPKGEYDRMIVGGEDHRVEIKMDKDKNFKALLEYVKTVLGDKEFTIVRKWTGGILESIDGLPFIGEIDKHLYVATAFSGTGMTYSAISAMIIRDLILKKENPYIDLYNPKRIPNLKSLLIKGKDYLSILYGGAIKNIFK